MHGPLNGEKTHPLSATALACLRSLLSGPRPKSDVNPGVVNRLTRTGAGDPLAELVSLPSPYKTRKGELVLHLQITDAGRGHLATADV